MSDFDYGNARLHAMKSRLLARQELETLAEQKSIMGLINALTKTALREGIELSLVQSTGMDALNRTRRNEYINSIGKARTYFSGKAEELANCVVHRYDVDNFKSILRGLRQQAPSDEILAGTVPAGELKHADLSRLAKVTNARMAIDLLATWRDPMAQPLLSLRALKPGADIIEMELVLERWYFSSAIKTADKYNASSLRKYARLNADIANILTAFRLINAQATADSHSRLNGDDPTYLFIGPGSISFAQLRDVTNQQSINRAINKLLGTPFAEILSGSEKGYRINQRLSEFETSLIRYQLKQSKNLLIGDPLGIGVFIGYAALKTNELANLHRIAHGIQLGESRDQIKKELIFID